MWLTSASGCDFQFFFQSKHVVSSICMKSERKGELALRGRRPVQAGWTPRSSGNCLSLSVCPSVCRALSHHWFYRIMLFTDSVASFWRTPRAEEKERACEESDWVRSESWPAGLIFTRMAFSGMRDWRCDVLWDVFEVEGTRWTNNTPSARGRRTFCVYLPLNDCDCDTLPSDVFLNHLTKISAQISHFTEAEAS